MQIYTKLLTICFQLKIHKLLKILQQKQIEHEIKYEYFLV